jgi:hypothetical protein
MLKMNKLSGCTCSCSVQNVEKGRRFGETGKPRMSVLSEFFIIFFLVFFSCILCFPLTIRRLSLFGSSKRAAYR